MSQALRRGSQSVCCDLRHGGMLTGALQDVHSHPSYLFPLNLESHEILQDLGATILDLVRYCEIRDGGTRLTWEEAAGAL